MDWTTGSGKRFPEGGELRTKKPPRFLERAHWPTGDSGRSWFDGRRRQRGGQIGWDVVGHNLASSEIDNARGAGRNLNLPLLHDLVVPLPPGDLHVVGVGVAGCERGRHEEPVASLGLH